MEVEIVGLEFDLGGISGLVFGWVETAELVFGWVGNVEFGELGIAAVEGLGIAEFSCAEIVEYRTDSEIVAFHIVNFESVELR